jgi:hypothetical protein
MKEKIKVGYGGSDCSCKHIECTLEDLTLSVLLEMLYAARNADIYKVCIYKSQFDALIKSIKEVNP